MKLNTLTDAPCQMTVGRAFLYICHYVKTCERGGVKDFEQRLRVHGFFPVDPYSRIIMESQCSATDQ